MAIILLPLCIFSQNSILKEEYNKNSFLKSNTNYQGRIISCSENNMIYFTDRGAVKNGTRNIYSYDIINEKFQVAEVINSKQTKLLFTDYIFSILVVKNLGFILNDEYIYSFTIRNNKWYLKNRQKNLKFYNTILPLNERECLLYVNYNFHPMDAKDRHVWAKYNIINDSITAITKMADHNVSFTHYVNSYISVYKGLIAYCNTTEYQVRFYDDNFKTVDSICTKELDQNKIHLSNHWALESKDAIIAFQKLDDSTLTRLQKIFLVDSSTLLVLKKIPKPNQFEFDLWQKTNGKWSLIQNEKTPGFYVNGEKYTSENQRCFDIFGNMYGIEIKDKSFYFLYYPFQSRIITDSYNRKKDYDEPMNERVRSDELYYGVSKFKILVN